MVTVEQTGLKLDLACGQNKQEGFYGVDHVETDVTDEIVDLLEFPWPWEDNSVSEIHCSHFVEHIPHRAWWIPESRHRDIFWMFLDEVWRVCQPDAKVSIIHPFANSDRADQDPSHERRINAVTWQLYASKDAREQNGLSHYPTVCDFEVVSLANSFADPRYTDKNRHQEVIMDLAAHQINIVGDLFVTLRAIKG